MELAPIGIPVLDEALGGGLPRGTVVLLEEETGTKPDALLATFLATGLKAGEYAYILSTDHPLSFSYQLLAAQGVDVEAALEEGRLVGIDGFTDAFGWGEFRPSSRYAIHDLSSPRLVHDVVRQAVMDLKPRNNLRGVIDSLTSIIHATRDPRALMTYVHHQMSAQKNHGNLLVYTVHRSAHSPETLGRLEHIVDGVISLRKMRSGNRWRIGLQIEKMRGVNFDTSLYECRVDRGRVTVALFDG